MNKTLAFVLIFVVFIVASGQTTKTPTINQQWEYKFDFSNTEKKANEMGTLGWELVAIQSTGPGLGNNVPTYVFRRPK